MPDLDADLRARRSSLLRASQLYVLVNGGSSATTLQSMADALVTAGVDVLQLRDKACGDRELLQRARLLRSVTRDRDTLFVVNDRPDLALLADADGVHVGQEELSVSDVRQLVGPDRLIGVSTHSLDQARQAVADGADYIGVGPTFPSSTKSFDFYPGLELLRQVAGEVELPAFAIGGITLDRLDAVGDSGFQRVAVAGAITQDEDPASVAREFVRRLR